MINIRNHIGWFFFMVKYKLGLAKEGIDFLVAPYDQYDPEVLKKFGIDADGNYPHIDGNYPHIDPDEHARWLESLPPF